MEGSLLCTKRTVIGPNSEFTYLHSNSVVSISILPSVGTWFFQDAFSLAVSERNTVYISHLPLHPRVIKLTLGHSQHYYK
jgi:hypothetical protein